MKTIEEQLKIINSLIGETKNIKIKEDGFISRGFVINNGELVFKFPRKNDVEYKTEIENLNYINSLNLGVKLQRVAFSSQTNEYLGIYGVLGNSLEEIDLNEDQLKDVGRQLGVFLKKLHNVKNYEGKPCRLNDEIKAWQQRVESVKDFIKETFSLDEQEIINNLMFDYLPKKLNQLGENLVFSHGDLGDGNIFIESTGNVGVIDFNESGCLDEAGDFMDVSSDIIRNEMLNSYGADKNLREKVELRIDIRPLIVLKAYLTRDNKEIINNLVNKIRKTLIKYNFLTTAKK